MLRLGDLATRLGPEAGRACAKTPSWVMPDTTFLVVAAAAFAAAALTWRSQRRQRFEHEEFCAAAARTTGVISRIGRRGYHSRNPPTSSDKVHTVAVVRFKAHDGVEYEIDAPGAPKTPGLSVEVAYDPEMPSTARLVAQRGHAGCTIVFLLAALAAAVAAFVRP